MIRQWWLGAFVIGLLASGLPARQGILTTRDGRILSGDINDGPDGKSVNITLHGATLTVSRDNVAAINFPADARDDFKRRLTALDPNDVQGRIDLSRFELSAREYDLAAQAAEDAERLDAHNPDAVILLDTIQSQRDLDAKIATTGPSASAGNIAASPPPAVANPSAAYLTMDDVYAIRRNELAPDDDVQVQFFNNVAQALSGLPRQPARFLCRIRRSAGDRHPANRRSAFGQGCPSGN